MKRIIVQTTGLLAATTILALTVNAFSPVGLPVTRALTLRELDARRPELFARGHIAGAQNLPTDEFGERFATMAGWLPKEAELVIYCDMKSCALSRQLADKLGEAGYGRVVIFRDGWVAWKERGWAAE